MRAEVVTAPSLTENESVIERDLRSFIEVGNALATIRDERQYVDAGFDTFEEYCKVKWDLGIRRAWQQIAAAKVADCLRVNNCSPSDLTEGQVRPLVKLYNEQGRYDPSTGEVRKPDDGERAVVEAWRQLTESHDDDKRITGQDVSRFLTHGATYNKPGWFELAGVVGDDLAKAGRHLTTVEQAITRRPRAQLVNKLGEYAGRADGLAARLRDLADGRSAE